MFVGKDDGTLVFVFSALVDEFREHLVGRREAEDTALAWLAENVGGAVGNCRVRFDELQMRGIAPDKGLFRLAKDFLGGSL